MENSDLLWDHVDELLAEAREANIEIIIHDPEEGLLLAVNPANKKVLDIGSQHGHLEICSINLQKWIWANDEGFTYKHLKKDEKLMNSIFFPIEGSKNTLKYLK